MVVVELDGGLATNLASQFNGQERVTVVTGDAREVEIDSLVGKNTSYKVVANLPYYAASPIIRRFLQATHKPRLMVVMVQREVAENIVAAPGKMRLISVIARRGFASRNIVETTAIIYHGGYSPWCEESVC